MAMEEYGQSQTGISIIQQLYDIKLKTNKYYMYDFIKCKSTCTLYKAMECTCLFYDWPCGF